MMSTQLRLYLSRKVIECLQQPPTCSPIHLQSLIQVGNVQSDNDIEMNLSLATIENKLGSSNISKLNCIEPDEIIKHINYSKSTPMKKISFKIDRNIFIRDVLENCTKPDLNLKPKRIVIDYSSPNIAKPFHMGHLRSTIIGNFIGNLSKFLNHEVTRLNYLGDWGTQFGLVKVGIDELKYNVETIKNNPLQILYNSYVHANKLAENNPEILEKARQEFNKLENGSSIELRYWQQYMDYSKTELENTYKRLGVTFDVYHSESMYKSKEIDRLLAHLTQKNLLKRDNEGRIVTLINDKSIPIVKSDGSTLYLTRDIAAAVDRFRKYKFDKMFYVVDNSQSQHFNNLKEVLHRMGCDWCKSLEHIRFGRVRGMSTRKGNAVFLSDILDECRDLMIKKQQQSPTTKVTMNDTTVSDILGISCVIINDLKQKRQKDYDFSWDKVLQMDGDTGVKLQYTHCRLHNLEENCGVIAAQETYPEYLEEPQVTALIKELSRFHEILYLANEQLEACVLVTYLFHLCNHINKAIKTLKVKGTERDIASQRLLLFKKSKEVLAIGMNILGLKPLTAM